MGLIIYLKSKIINNKYNNDDVVYFIIIKNIIIITGIKLFISILTLHNICVLWQGECIEYIECRNL